MRRTQATSLFEAFTGPTATAKPAAAAQPPARLWQSFVTRLLAAQRALEGRRALLEMEPRMLQDIGISHGEAMEEARRALWDLTPRPRGRRF